MKRNTLFAVLLLATVVFSACKKEIKPADRTISAGEIPPPPPPPMTLSGVLGTGHATADIIHLTTAYEWHLSGLVYVDSTDQLIIDPGTTIVGDLRTIAGVPGGGLVITRGAKIIAEGTAANPIIFTSASATPVSGDWSGVVIIGNASTNHAIRVNPEGIPQNAPVDVSFGGNTGTNDEDSSGVFKYVRIEYAGFILSLNNEINGLTLAGVGSKTTIDYVEVFKAYDDAFEFFGGKVNASHLIAVDAYDDLFDTDNGYRGTISYALGLTDTTRANVSTSNGIESDNDPTGSSATPLINPVYKYLTIIGLPNSAKASSVSPFEGGTYGRAAHLRRNSRYNINHSIFMGYNYGISQDLTLGSAAGSIDSNFVHAFVSPFQTEAGSVRTPVTAPAGNITSTTVNPNAAVLLGNPFRRDSIANYVAIVLSPALVKRSGAFPTGNTTWANGWSRLR